MRPDIEIGYIEHVSYATYQQLLLLITLASRQIGRINPLPHLL